MPPKATLKRPLVRKDTETSSSSESNASTPRESLPIEIPVVVVDPLQPTALVDETATTTEAEVQPDTEPTSESPSSEETDPMASNVEYHMEEAEAVDELTEELDEFEVNADEDEDIDGLEADGYGYDPMSFQPSMMDYMIRQQQIATYQMLCQFLVHQDRSVTETLNDVRVSIDCLTKSVLQLTKTIDRHLAPISKVEAVRKTRP